MYTLILSLLAFYLISAFHLFVSTNGSEQVFTYVAAFSDTYRKTSILYY